MKVAIFLLALIGACCALQAPLEYRYHYEGRMGFAIPKLSAKVSATGIEAKVNIQMKPNGVGIVKLDNVKVGHFIGDFHSNHLRQKVPIQMSSLSKYAKQIEDPFAVNFMQQIGHVMDTTQDEPEWVTNIKKAIIENFLLNPVKHNFENIQGSQHGRVYSVEEESIFGRCRSIYTITPIPMHMQASYVQQLRVQTDVQSKKTPSTSSIPKLSEELWKMVRTIDFDSCTDRVILQHDGYGNYSEAGRGRFEAVSTRSSVGSYIMRGSPGHFRIEKAMVEGSFVKSSFGFQSEKMETLTNQTLILDSVQPVTTPLRVPPTRPVKTWRYEVVSPFSPDPQVPRNWVIYRNQGQRFAPVHPLFFLYGKNPTPQYSEQAMNLAYDFLKKAASDLSSFIPPHQAVPSKPTLSGMPGVNVVRYLRDAQFYIGQLPVSYIEKLFTKVSGSSSTRQGKIMESLLIDVASATGSTPALKVITQKILSSEISETRMASIFMGLTNQLTSPVLIPELMDVVIQKVNLKTVPGPQILINFANLLNRHCLNRKAYNYTLPNPIYGEYICNPSIISSKFVPYLRTKLTESGSTLTQKIAVMEAMSILGAPQLLDIMKPVLLGTGPTSLRSPLIRIACTIGFANGRMPQALRTEMMKDLLQVIDDVSEPTELRQMAVITLLSHNPGVAIWNKLARQTWREPSKELAAFIYFTIDNLASSSSAHHAEQTVIAKYVRGLARPFSHAFQYSYNFDRSSYLQHDKLNLYFDMSRIVNPALFMQFGRLIPREFLMMIKPNLGGIVENLAEISFSTEGFGSLYGSNMPTNPHSSAGRQQSGPYEPRVNILSNSWDNVLHTLSLGPEELRSGNMKKILTNLVNGESFNVTKYASPMTESLYLPTELGIPMIAMTSIPMVIQSDCDIRLEMSEKSNDPTFDDLLRSERISLLSKSYTKIVSKLSVSLGTITPWNEDQVFVQIDNVRQLNLPIYTNLTVLNTTHVTNVTLNVAPLEGQAKLRPIFAENVPYVAIVPKEATSLNDVKYEPLTINPSSEPSHKYVRPIKSQRTGIKGDLIFDGDVPSPYSRGFIVDYLRQPPKLVKLLSSPTAKLWRTYLEVHPQSSATQNVSLSLSFTRFGKMVFQPSSMSSSPSGQLPKFSPDDTPQERAKKIQQMTQGQETTIALNGQLSFNGSEFRKYEALGVLSRQTPITEKVKKYDLILSLMETPLTNSEKTKKVLSFESKINTPSFTDGSQMIDMIENNGIKQTIEGQVTFGQTTSSKKIASVRIDAFMSPKRQEVLKREVKNLCAFDPLNPINHLRTPAVYDEFKMDLNYQESDVPRTVMNNTLNIVDFFRSSNYPYTYINRYNVNNGKGKVEMTLKRPVWSETYSIRTLAPTEQVTIDNIYIPEPFVSIMPVRKLNVRCDSQRQDLILNSVGSPNTCTINMREVRTFDGVTYPLLRSKCGVIVAKNFEDISNSYKVFALEESPSMIKTIFKLIKNNQEIWASFESVQINGQTMTEQSKSITDSSGRQIMVIIKKRNHINVIIPHEVEVNILKTHLQVIPLVSQGNAFRGLCGDFDGNQKFDFTGPKGCIYTNTTLYQVSWMEKAGSECDSAKYDSQYQYVTEFQQGCQHRDSASPMELEQEFPYMHVYPITKEQSDLCISEEPIKKCKPTFRMIKKEPYQAKMKCWTESNAPSEVVSAYNNKGYMQHPINKPQEKMMKMKLMKAKYCQ